MRFNCQFKIEQAMLPRPEISGVDELVTIPKLNLGSNMQSEWEETAGTEQN